ncbi:MAG TPA: hypothetical protein VG714_00225 [Acidobacteriaceae bacterium]|nr:hypothetical protein [Acidobacteriaceae bacterium]
MSKGHAVLRFLRTLHLYIGVFISPALLFFAFTGALQTFSLHETTPGRDYTPPKWAMVLAQIHKKQTSDVPVKKLKPPQADASADDAGHEGHRHKKDGASGSGHEDAAAAGPEMAKAPEAKASGAPATGAPQRSQKSHLPLKIFFLLAAIGLFTSTLTGIYMAYKYSRGVVMVTALLVAGVVIPLLLLPF